MKVLYQKLPRRRIACIATIGVFDGIHRGHRYILSNLRREARRKHLLSLVITFDRAPQHFLQKSHFANTWSIRKPFTGYISDRKQKTELIASCGIDQLWFLKTSRRLLELPGRDFIAYICKYFSIKKLIVGSDFRFGYAGSCSVEDLRQLSREFGFSLVIIAKRRKNAAVISSSRIRELIQRGEMKKLVSFLGRPFSLRGRVIRGKHLGSRIGFPTANIIAGEYVLPKPGVYAAYVLLEKKLLSAAVFVSSKKKTKPALVEAYLIDFHSNILGKTITVVFSEYIREKRTFRSLASLRRAIQKDVGDVAAKCSVAKPSRTQLLVL